MSNSSARSRSNVEIKHVIIDLTAKDERSQLPPTAANLHEASNHAPIQEGPQPTANMLAAQLAVDEKIRMSELQEDFSNIFLQYHKACVQVICTTEEYGETKGSGILFKDNVSETVTRLILVTAAHVIRNTDNLELVIEYNYKPLPSEKVGADKIHIIDIDRKEGIDVAVIFLNDMDSAYILDKIAVSEIPHPSFASTESVSDTFMSIHYAKRRPDIYKQVCVGRVGSTKGNFSELRPILHIDGGPGASGAPLFNIEGDVVAILNSRQIFDGFYRDFIRIENVFKDDNLSGRDEFRDLHLIEKNEGLQSKNRLRALFQRNLQRDVSNEDMRDLIRLLEESQTLQHRHILRVIVFDCLGKGGPHRVTRQWSLLKYVESDHFPAHDAYKRATNYPESREFESGENLPAITIPKVIHKKLDTTGRSHTSEAFRSVQAEYIGSGNTWAAIEANFDDYKKKGLFRRRNYDCADEDFGALLEKYRKGFENALQLHVKLDFINEGQKQYLIDHIGRLIENGQACDEELELTPEDKIAIKRA